MFFTQLQSCNFAGTPVRRIYARQMTGVERGSIPNRRINVPLLVEWAVGVVLAVTIIAYMLLGNFTRYVQDDFLTTLDDRAYGFWGTQVLTYQQNDGHYLGTALQEGGALLNVAFVRVLPGILIAAWVVALTLALRHLVPSAGRLGRLLIAAGIVYATLRITPSPFLSVYWMNASLAYVVPLLLAAVLVWLVSRPRVFDRRHGLILFVTALVAFLAAGLAEEYTVAQTVAVTLALAVAVGGARVRAAWRQKLPVLAAASIGSAAGLGFMAASPGDALRSAAIARVVGPRPSLLGLPGFTIPEVLHFLHALVETHWRGLIAMAILAAYIGARSGGMSRGAVRALLIPCGVATAGAFVVIFGAMTPAAFEMAQPPHDYSQIVLINICVCAVATLGWVGGRLCRAATDRAWPDMGALAGRRAGVAAVASVLAGVASAAGPVSTLASIHHDLPAIQAYAATKDAQAAAAEAAHAAGVTSAIVPLVAHPEDLGIFSHTNQAELQADPTYWLNADVATYYGLATIATSPAAR